MRLQQLVQEVAPSAQLHIATSGAIDARRSAVKVDDVERTLKRKVDCQIPADAGAALAAVNFGKPISEAAPNSGIVKALRPLVAGLDQPGGVERRGRQGGQPARPVRPAHEEEIEGDVRSAQQEARAAEAPAGALDRIGRRTSAEPRADAQRRRPIGKQARLASAAAALRDAVAPRLRDLVKAGAPAGEITRQAGLLAQTHFRGNGVLLAPLELRGYVADVLRPVLPATSFAQPAVAAAEPAPAEAAPAPVPAAAAGAVPTPDLSERPPQAASAAVLALQPRPVEPAEVGRQVGQQAVAQQGRPGAPRRAAPGDEPHRPRGRGQPAAQGTGAPARGPGRRTAGRASPPAQPAGAGRTSSTSSSTT